MFINTYKMYLRLVNDFLYKQCHLLGIIYCKLPNKEKPKKYLIYKRVN